MEKHLFEYGQFVSCREKNESNPGIFTKNAIKVECAYNARDSIAFDAVSILDDLVCENPFQKEHSRRNEIRQKFIQQMKGYRIINAENKSPFETKKVTVSGKVNDQGKLAPGRNDDLFCTFTLINFWMTKFYRGELPGINYALLRD